MRRRKSTNLYVPHFYAGVVCGAGDVKRRRLRMQLRRAMQVTSLEPSALVSTHCAKLCVVLLVSALLFDTAVRELFKEARIHFMKGLFGNP